LRFLLSLIHVSTLFWNSPVTTVQPQFSPKQVAQALSVGESTVKRWCDAGCIRTVRTQGGHRRIPLNAVLDFLASSNYELSDPAAIGLTSMPERSVGEPNQSADIRSGSADSSGKDLNGGDTSSIQQTFLEALTRGEEGYCRRLLRERCDVHRSPTTACEELICHSMHAIGHAWERQAIEVYQERRAVGICDRLVMELRKELVDRVGEQSTRLPHAIGGAAEGDFYSLPSAMVELALCETGWLACNHGNNLPLETMEKAVRECQPALVWISISEVVDEARLVSQFNRLADALSDDIMLVVGGRGLTDQLRPRLRYTAYCDNLRQLVNLASALRTRCV